MGRVSNLWAEVQDQYYKWLKKRNTGKKWLAALIAKAWEITWSMWDDRNDVKHKGMTLEKKRRHQELDVSMRRHYELGPSSLRRNQRKRFKVPKKTVLGYELLHKEQWVLLMDLARQRSVDKRQDLRNVIRRQRYLMNNWRNSGKVTEPSSTRSRAK